MIIDPYFQFIDVENEQWWNFRARGPLAPKYGRRLLVLHDGRKPLAASLGDAPLVPLPGPFAEAREAARQLYEQYAPLESVWVYDQPNLDRYSVACGTWTGELDVHDYRNYKIEQAAKLTSADFAVHPLRPFQIGYLGLAEAQRFLKEELPSQALLILAVFEDQVYFSLVVQVVDHRIKTLTTSDHFAKQIAAAGFGQANGVVPFTPQATVLLEELSREELGPLTISLFMHRKVYEDLFTASDRIAALASAEVRGDVWGTSVLPKKHDAWQKLMGLLSYLVFEP